MRFSGRRCSALLVGAVLALSACDGGDDSPEPKPSTSAEAAAPALPVVTPGATAGVPVAQVGRPLWTSTDKRVGLGRFDGATIVDGTVVAAGDDSVAAVEARTGRVIWSRKADYDNQIPGTGGSYYLRLPLPGPVTVSGPAAGVGRVVLVGYGSAGRNGGGLMALSMRTGAVVWQRKFGDDVADLPNLEIVGASATRVLVAAIPGLGRLPAPSSDVRAVALDTATGKILWQRSKSIAGRLSGDTAVLIDVPEAQIMTFPARTAGPVIGVDAGTGRGRWRLTGKGYSADSVDAATDRTVVVGSSSSRLVDTSTGRTLWTSTGFSACESDNRRLVACTSGEHLVSWSTTDPVVRASALTVKDFPTLIENGRVHLNGFPRKVVDLSGSPRLTSLDATAIDGSGGLLVLAGPDTGNDFPISVVPVSPGR